VAKDRGYCPVTGGSEPQLPFGLDEALRWERRAFTQRPQSDQTCLVRFLAGSARRTRCGGNAVLHQNGGRGGQSRSRATMDTESYPAGELGLTDHRREGRVTRSVRPLRGHSATDHLGKRGVSKRRQHPVVRAPRSSCFCRRSRAVRRQLGPRASWRRVQQSEPVTIAADTWSCWRPSTAKDVERIHWVAGSVDASERQSHGFTSIPRNRSFGSSHWAAATSNIAAHASVHPANKPVNSQRRAQRVRSLRGPRVTFCMLG